MMIPLNENHKEMFINFVQENPTLNLFYMGDYLAYGFNDPSCKYFARIDKGLIITCVMVYKNSLHLSGRSISEEDKLEVYHMLKEYKIEKFNTSDSFIDVIEGLPYESSLEKCFLSVYSSKEVYEDYRVEDLDLEYVDDFIAVQDSCFTMVSNRDETLDNIQAGRTRSYVSKEDGKIVSIASATAFTPDAAMIIGVGTLEAYRSRGHAKRTMKKLCSDLAQEGIKAVLFYVNPIAGKMYHEIGFVDQEPYYLTSIPLDVYI